MCGDCCRCSPTTAACRASGVASSSHSTSCRSVNGIADRDVAGAAEPPGSKSAAAAELHLSRPALYGRVAEAGGDPGPRPRRCRDADLAAPRAARTRPRHRRLEPATWSVDPYDGRVSSPAPATAPADPPERWSALRRLALAMVLAMTTWFSASAVLPQLRAEWSLSSSQGAWLTIAVQLGFVVGAVASAVLNLADLVPARRLMLSAPSEPRLSTWAWSSPTGQDWRCRCASSRACSWPPVYPPGLKAMATWFRRGRGTALGVMVGALTLGSAMPHLVNGLGGVQWQVVIVATSALTVAGGLIAEYVARDGPFPFPAATFEPGQARRAFADRGVRLANIGYFGHMWELYAMWAWFAVFFADRLALDAGGDPRRPAAFATALRDRRRCDRLLGRRRPRRPLGSHPLDDPRDEHQRHLRGADRRVPHRAGPRRTRDRAGVGLLGDRRLRPVLRHRHRGGRPALRRHHGHPPARRRASC